VVERALYVTVTLVNINKFNPVDIVFLKISRKLLNSMDKFLFPAKATYFAKLLYCLLFGHGLPLLMEENEFVTHQLHGYYIW
jgi:hypothetical protein